MYALYSAYVDMYVLKSMHTASACCSVNNKCWRTGPTNVSLNDHSFLMVRNHATEQPINFEPVSY